MDKSEDFLCSNFDKNFETMQLENVKICEYSDLSNVSNYKSPSDALFMFHINIRSIQKHNDILYELISSMCRSPDVITEISIQEAPAVNIELQGYNLIFANSSINAGGVAM